MIGPNLRAFDFSLSKNIPPTALSEASRLQVRAEFFNLTNRTNFGAPALIAFAGTRDGESPLPSFGRIRDTVTDARQIQLELRFSF